MHQVSQTLGYQSSSDFYEHHTLPVYICTTFFNWNISLGTVATLFFWNWTVSVGIQLLENHSWIPSQDYPERDDLLGRKETFGFWNSKIGCQMSCWYVTSDYALPSFDVKLQSCSSTQKSNVPLSTTMFDGRQVPCNSDANGTWESGNVSGWSWWFHIFLIFTPIWGNDPIWLILFKGVETTN